MVGKNTTYTELTLNDRKTIFGILWSSCRNGKQNGEKVKVAKSFQVAPITVTRVWDDVCSVMEAHLIKEMSLEGLHFFDERTLPLRIFPDHVFEPRKKGRVGRKIKYDRAALKERVLNVPLNDRGTYRDLASQIEVSKDTVKALIDEGNFRVHSSSLKPYLTEVNKDERYQFATSKIDMLSMDQDNWQYRGMFDEVHVDEKWFNKTFDKRRYVLAQGEEEPNRKVRHKKHIPKIMFLSAQARPRHDPNKNCMWDGKLALIPTGIWCRAKVNSKYYRKGDEKWKNRNVDTQASFERMEDIVRSIANNCV